MEGGEPSMKEEEEPFLPSMEDEIAAEAEAKAGRRKLGDLRPLKYIAWRPRVNLTSRLERLEAERDGQIVDTLADELLAIELTKDTRTYLVDFVKAERKSLGLKNGKLLQEPALSEPLLRRLAHLILSLPEAQLN